MTPESGFDLSVEADLENLHLVRDYVDRAGKKLGMSSSALADLRLVVDEAVTNVVLHAYKGQGGPVEMHIEPDGEDIVVQIRDRAESFDAEQVAAPQLDTDLDHRPFGGMGIYLIREMTDEAEFRALPGGGNELTLRKKGVIERES